MMKIALVGTGFITESFIQSARQCGGVEISAVVSRAQETALAFAQKHDIPLAYTSLEQVAQNPEIAAVYIASPNAQHMPQAIRMLQAGKHVLCEKPVASNAKEFQQMLACARKTGKVLLEAVRNAYTDQLDTLKTRIAEMGQPRRAVLVYCRYSSRYDAFLSGKYVNTFNPDLSNSALMDMGMYCVRLLLELFGVPEGIAAAGVKLENGFEASGTICARYPSMTAELLYSKVANTCLVSEIQFDHGTIQIADVASVTGVRIHRNGSTTVLDEPARGIGLVSEIERFMSLIEHPEQLERYNKLSLATMELMDEARRQTGVVFPADRI